jgi:hypothetical protein
MHTDGFGNSVITRRALPDTYNESFPKPYGAARFAKLVCHYHGRYHR